MSKTGKLFTTTLRLNLDKAPDQEAWDNLMSADTRLPEYSSYSRTIITAINDHFARKDNPIQDNYEPTLLKKIEETIRQTITNSLKENGITEEPKPKVANPPIEYEEIDDTFETDEGSFDWI